MAEGKVVYKYPFSRDGVLTTTLPISLYMPVLVGRQGDIWMMWIERWLPEDGYPFRQEEVTYQIFGTGQMVPTEATHVMSFQDGSFVWHVYRVTKAIVPLAVDGD